MTNLRRLLIATAVALCAVAASTGPARVAQSAPKWAPASIASIHPGVQTRAPSGQCTANFVFYDAKSTYIGQAAHCSSLGGQTDTNGCETPVLPLGSRVAIEGASRRGTIVYNSWVTMQGVRERNLNTCLGNDFALVRIDRADVRKVNPSIPVWGGPTGLASRVGTGSLVYTYGNSALRQGIDALSPKFGLATFDDFGGWNHGIYTITPGIFGDSGSAVVDSQGRALGALSTIEALPMPAENNVSSLYKALAYMKRHTSLDGITLAKGTVRFAGTSGLLSGLL